jgi:HEAT repeat protein
MTQALSGAALAAVLAVCWLMGRPRRPMLRSTDTTAVAALNRGQIERLLDAATPPAAASQEEAGAPPASWPRDARSRGLLLRPREQQFRHAGEPRRQALAACAAWGDRAALPLIRRGLRDSDPAVVALAAAAIGRFRGRTSPAAQPQRTARLPRTVSRTR